MIERLEGRAGRKIVYQRFEIVKQETWTVEAYLETHPGRFSVMEVMKATGLSQTAVERVVKLSSLVKIYDETMIKPGPQKRYVSIAVPPSPTLEGTREEVDIILKYSDELGREARADYYELIRVRSLCLHQGKRRC